MGDWQDEARRGGGVEMSILELAFHGQQVLSLLALAIIVIGALVTISSAWR